MRIDSGSYSLVPQSNDKGDLSTDHSSMLTSSSGQRQSGDKMTTESGDHATSYSKWDSNSESISIGMRNEGKGGCLASLSWKKWLAILIGVGVATLVLGFIFGYLTRRSYHLRDVEEIKGSNPADVGGAPQAQQDPTTAPNQGYTDEAFEKLSKKISTESIQQYISDYMNSNETYHAGSTAINASAHEMTKAYCKSLGIKLQQVTFSKVLISRPGAENSANYQVTGARTYTNNVPNDVPDTLKPFVAYTADGQAQGPPVYAAYGRREDFEEAVNYTGSVCYIRYGKVNPFYMITNAASRGCVAAVLYPDPQEFPSLELTDRIISNGKRLSGDPLTPGWPSVSEHSYRLTMSELSENILPPSIPVITASQEMAIPALLGLLGNSSMSNPDDQWQDAFSQGSLQSEPATDTQVSVQSSVTHSREMTYRSVCATRGTVDLDKFILVGTHHDEAGSGAADPATGQAIMREMMRLVTLYQDIYKPRRSIIFVTKDGSYLDISTQEWIEENRREYGERALAYVAINSALSEGSTLQVKSSGPVKSFMKEVISNSPEVDIVQHGDVKGSKHYRGYLSNLGAPIIEMGFSKKASIDGVDALPVCCRTPQVKTDARKIEFAAKNYLKAIMRLAGEIIVPYDLMEIKGMYADGIAMVKQTTGKVDDGAIQDLSKLGKGLGVILGQLTNQILFTNHSAMDAVSVRRVNDALTGITRACILPQGVPMLDPNDPAKVIRNLNNRNMLTGSVSTDDNQVVVFPGLVELFSAPQETQEIRNEIKKHITEITMSMVDAKDYGRRAIMDSMTFPKLTPSEGQ